MKSMLSFCRAAFKADHSGISTTVANGGSLEALSRNQPLMAADQSRAARGEGGAPPDHLPNPDQKWARLMRARPMIARNRFGAARKDSPGACLS